MIEVAIIIAIILAIYCYNMKKKAYKLKHKHDNEPPYAPFTLSDDEIKMLNSHGVDALNPDVWSQRLGCLILSIIILVTIIICTLVWEMLKSMIPGL